MAAPAKLVVLEEATIVMYSCAPTQILCSSKSISVTFAISVSIITWSGDPGQCLLLDRGLLSSWGRLFTPKQGSLEIEVEVAQDSSMELITWEQWKFVGGKEGGDLIALSPTWSVEYDQY